MSKSIQDILERMLEKKRQLKLVRNQVKDLLQASPEWVRANEAFDIQRRKKKSLEQAIIPQELQKKTEELSLAVRMDQQMLSDIALTAIMKGEPINAKVDGKEFEPHFKVTLKQMKLL